MNSIVWQLGKDAMLHVGVDGYLWCGADPEVGFPPSDNVLCCEGCQDLLESAYSETDLERSLRAQAAWWKDKAMREWERADDAEEELDEL